MSLKLNITIFALFFSSILNIDNIIIINNNEGKNINLEGSEIYIATEFDYGRAKIIADITSSQKIDSVDIGYNSTDSLNNIPQTFSSFSGDEVYLLLDYRQNVNYIIDKKGNPTYGIIRLKNLNNQYVNININIYVSNADYTGIIVSIFLIILLCFFICICIIILILCKNLRK